MANRRFEQFGGTLERKVVKLFAKVLYTGGAPTLVDTTVLNVGTSPVTVNESQGIQSLGAGTQPESFFLYFGNNNGGVPEYDTYVRLLNVSASATVASGSPTNVGLGVVIAGEDVAGATGLPRIELLSLRFAAPSGPVVAGLPDDGTVLYIEITLSNTTAY